MVVVLLQWHFAVWATLHHLACLTQKKGFAFIYFSDVSLGLIGKKLSKRVCVTLVPDSDDDDSASSLLPFSPISSPISQVPMIALMLKSYSRQPTADFLCGPVKINEKRLLLFKTCKRGRDTGDWKIITENVESSKKVVFW